MRQLPSGTVTFLFTDVEGSTRLLHELGAERYAESLAEHRRVIRQASADEGGIEVDSQGDAFFIAFSDAARAARAARAIAAHLENGPMRVRIGLHTGQPLVAGEGYIGEDVHLGARIAAAGYGGQVLMSGATRDAAAAGGMPVVDLGEHRLKDMEGPIAIYQLGVASFPPLKTISNTNLPRAADSFLGRADEVAEVVNRTRSGRRLLTLLGPGGTGKTRLATEAATALLGDFKAGVFWVDLTPVRDPDAVAHAIAATLGTEQELGAHIGEREMLLVLDNFEQVVEAAPRIGSLVTACARLSVIVTSRERLRVRGESVLAVPALDQADAAQLFADRSGLPRSAEIEELCARLENLPLAVELAAARTSALTPRQILDRLAGRLDLLRGGRDADPRQRTLRATIEWSHDLLSEQERWLFRRLSVFAGGATLEAVETVCESDVDTLESLIDKSLVRSVDGRYTMLETVREYAAERLEAAGEKIEIRDRHAEFVRDLMATGIPELMAGGDDALGLSLTAELGNLQSAFAWYVESGDSSRAAKLLDTVWWFVGEFLSRSRAGLAMCEALLAMPELSDAELVTARHREGNFVVQLADLDRARKAWKEAAEVAHRIGDAREAHVMQNLAIVTADPAEAIPLFEQAVAIAPPDDERLLYSMKWNLAGLKRRAGDSEAADALLREVLAWAKGAGDYQYNAAGERELAEAALLRGDASTAFESATRSRDQAAGRGQALMTLLAEMLRARAAIRLGRERDAVQSVMSVMDLLREGDLEADEEIAAGAIGAAIEVFAATDERGIVGQLESARLRVTERRPWVAAGFERSHTDWLAQNDLVVDADVEPVDLSTALMMIRDALLRHEGARDA